MSGLRVRATDEARDYIERIAAAMIQLFSIPRDEAIGRINEFWGEVTFLAPHELVTLLHQGPDYWAKVIYHEGRRPPST